VLEEVAVVVLIELKLVFSLVVEEVKVCAVLVDVADTEEVEVCELSEDVVDDLSNKSILAYKATDSSSTRITITAMTIFLRTLGDLNPDNALVSRPYGIVCVVVAAVQ